MPDDLPPEVAAQIRELEATNPAIKPKVVETRQAQKERRARLEAENVVLSYHPVDWDELWSQEGPEKDWLIEPLIPMGRQVAMFSPAKAGKSLVTLDMVAALASGRPVFGQPAMDPVDVVYIDMEMTKEDLRDRLEDLGYGPETDLSHLHYYTQQVFAPFDDRTGGVVVEILADHHHAKLVVVDTMARVVSGEEDAADTYRAFYFHTGLRLKSKGIALLRLDHAGKEGSKGQRGSSAKNDDVDLVWALTKPSDDLRILTCTHQRVAWVPHEVRLTLQTEPYVAHVLAPHTYPQGTMEAVRELDKLGIPEDASGNKAQSALRKAGHGRTRTVVLEAQKYRSRRGKVVRNHLEADSPNHQPNYPTNHQANHPRTSSGASPNRRGGECNEPPPTGAVRKTGNEGAEGDEGIDEFDPLEEDF